MQEKINALLQAIYEQQAHDHTRALNPDAKQPALGWLGGLFSGIVLTALEIAAQQIKEPLLKGIATVLIGEVREFATILTDSNKDNAAQIKTLYAANWRDKAKIWLGIIENIIRLAMPQSDVKERLLQKIAALLAMIETAE